ncbi:MAG TPA: aminopeptidase P family protein [Actinomycetota bacterium]|nr:aminopeptidase P family protein [Actinomycetota bacterium]
MDHAARRARLRDRLPEVGIDALLLTRGVNVRYLTGFTGSNGQLVLTEDGAVFFTDSRYEEQSAREIPDLPREIYLGSFAAAFGGTCRDAKLRRVGFEAAGVTYKTYGELSEALEGELTPVEDEVERLRWAKDGEEIRLLERAQELTDEGFDRLTGKLSEGITERAAAFELELAMREAGAERVAFETIVAFGENAAEPHHRPTDRELRRGDLVKLDFGCVVDGYHSDMTRTVAFGDPGPELRDVHALVLRAQATGVEAVRAGVSGGQADEAARAVIREAGFGERFGHSLGHGVGLEIHEGPTLRSESSDVLPPGAVVTVEPGVYLPGRGGVRIEDMVVVQDDGARPLPRTTHELVVL